MYPRILESLAGLAPLKHLSVTHAVGSYAFPLEIWDATMTTLYLFGAANVGKTTLAKALLPKAMMTRHLDLLSKYKGSGYHGIILDDVKLKHKGSFRESELAVLERVDATQIHIRYKVAEIPPGTPMIITSNLEPSESMSMHDAAIARRVTCVRMISPQEFQVVWNGLVDKVVVNYPLFTTQIPKPKELEVQGYDKNDVFEYF